MQLERARLYRDRAEELHKKAKGSPGSKIAASLVSLACEYERAAAKLEADQHLAETRNLPAEIAGSTEP
jgi:hypothetical protein